MQVWHSVAHTCGVLSQRGPFQERHCASAWSTGTHAEKRLDHHGVQAWTAAWAFACSPARKGGQYCNASDWKSYQSAGDISHDSATCKSFLIAVCCNRCI